MGKSSHYTMKLFLSLFPLGIHLPRKLDNLPAQFHKVDGTLFQLVEQHHRLLLREVAAQFLHDLVVVRADGTELGVEIGQPGAVCTKSGLFGMASPDLIQIYFTRY